MSNNRMFNVFQITEKGEKHRLTKKPMIKQDAVNCMVSYWNQGINAIMQPALSKDSIRTVAEGTGYCIVINNVPTYKVESLQEVPNKLCVHYGTLNPEYYCNEYND